MNTQEIIDAWESGVEPYVLTVGPAKTKEDVTPLDYNERTNNVHWRKIHNQWDYRPLEKRFNSTQRGKRSL